MDAAGKDLVQRINEEEAMEVGFWEAKWGAAADRHHVSHNNNNNGLGGSGSNWGWSDRGEAEAMNRSCVCGGDESPSVASESSSSLSSTNRAETHSSFSATSSESVLPCSPPIGHRRRITSPFIRGGGEHNLQQRVLSPLRRPQIGYHNFEEEEEEDDDVHGYGGGSSEYSGSITGYASSPAVPHVVDGASPALSLRQRRHRAWDDDGAGEDSGTDSDSWASASSRQLLDHDEDEDDDGKGEALQVTERSAGAAATDDIDGGERTLSSTTANSTSFQGCPPQATDKARSSIQRFDVVDGRLTSARHGKPSHLWSSGKFNKLSNDIHQTDDDAAAAPDVVAATPNLFRRPWPSVPQQQLSSTCRLSTPVSTRFPSSFLQGYLRFAGERDGGSPFYSFSAVASSSSEVLFARSHRLDHNADDQWMYTFYTRRDHRQQKYRGGHGSRASWMEKKGEESTLSAAPDLLGKMRVSGGGEGGGDEDAAAMVETRFVLYCEDEEMGDHGALEAGRDGEEEDRLSMAFMPSSTWKKKSQREEEQQHRHHLNQLRRRRSEGSAAEEMTKSRRCRKTELAAIVITSRSVKDERKQVTTAGVCSGSPAMKKSLQATDASTPSISDRLFTTTTTTTPLVKSVDRGTGKSQGAGWGLGFLKEGDNNTSAEKGWGMSFLLDNRSSALNVQKMMVTSHPQRTADVTVILPAGYHGLPHQNQSEIAGARSSSSSTSCRGGGGGPTPLLERWRSGGGGCDCGGWDLGCGLSVLKSTDTFKLPHKPSGIALTRHDLLNWPRKPLTISTQGRDPVVLLSMDFVEPGLFSLRFQAPRFTTLQAFATAVAILHQQQQIA